ncbi:MAG: beta-aspartyl-peptidase [Proteobacteria bacterium]|nr:beta-aspartyl-peptidase [Pseudomonadota bacterium]MBU4277999.1 beta-aspartyl-peptidase [Pseudomonadota bacterium]MBU4384448.1 beta-aspartyl-peptidase [Pseudomonadota bacterium]MCG2766182.1 beta-aspartyl-peptidase [Desulfarculaceae bacterium]
MITIIRNVHVYSPEDLGVQDVLIVGKQIHAVGGDFDLWAKLPETTEIDGTGKLLVPGFVDSHVHILGGGGAAGFGSRGPETSFSETVLAGTTTVVGVVGVDQEGRDLKTLYAKTKSLEFRGITAKMFTCGFDTEVTITGSIKSDIYLLDNVIGAKCCVSDRRGAQTTYEDLKKAMATAALGGLLSRKAGVLHIHMGDAPAGLMPVIEAQQETAVMIKNIVPTHINRNELLMEQGLTWTKNGGVVDFTPCIYPPDFKRATKTAQAVSEYLKAGVPIEQITISTDANGVHTIHGFERMARNPMDLMYKEFLDMIKGEGISMTDCLKCVSTNVARVLRLEEKGKVAPGMDADLMLLDPESLEIKMVIALGVKLVENGRLVSPPPLDV